MHITFLSARYPPDVLGGGEVSTQLIAEALAREGERVTVLTGARKDRDEDLNGVHVVRRTSLYPWWKKPLNESAVSRAAARMVYSLLTTHYSQPPDILHAHEFRSALALSLLPGSNRVVTIRDYAPICGTTNNMWWDGSICDGCFWPNVLFRCHRVAEASMVRKPVRVLQYKGNLGFRLRAYRALPHHVYTSDALRRRIQERLPTVSSSTTTAVIPNPLDSRWTAHDPPPLPAAPILCAAGRLETTKGTDVLLSALTRIHQAMPNVHLHLVGGGEMVRFRRLAQQLGLGRAVTFHGPQPTDRVRDLIDGSAIVVSPHRWEEPFGRAALEAGARARPLVASDLGGVSETTTPATAVFVPPRDPTILSDALLRLLRDRQRAEELGRHARAFVTSRFDPHRIAGEHLEFYRRLVRR